MGLNVAFPKVHLIINSWPCYKFKMSYERQSLGKWDFSA